jgi:hypothetical protein
VASWLISGVWVAVRHLFVDRGPPESARCVEQIGHVDLLDIFEANLVEMPRIQNGIRGSGWRGWRRSGVGGLFRRILGRCRRRCVEGFKVEQVIIEIEESEPVVDLSPICGMNSGGSPCGTNAGPRFRVVVFYQRGQKKLRTQNRGAATSGVLRDLPVGGDDSELSGR